MVYSAWSLLPRPHGSVAVYSTRGNLREQVNMQSWNEHTDELNSAWGQRSFCCPLTMLLCVPYFCKNIEATVHALWLCYISLKKMSWGLASAVWHSWLNVAKNERLHEPKTHQSGEDRCSASWCWEIASTGVSLFQRSEELIPPFSLAS